MGRDALSSARLPSPRGRRGRERGRAGRRRRSRGRIRIAAAAEPPKFVLSAEGGPPPSALVPPLPRLRRAGRRGPAGGRDGPTHRPTRPPAGRARAAMKKPDGKVVLLGDMNVGKTSLLHRYMEKRFQETVSTVGGAFYLKQWGPYNISIWDTAGETPGEGPAGAGWRGVVRPRRFPVCPGLPDTWRGVCRRAAPLLRRPRCGHSACVRLFPRFGSSRLGEPWVGERLRSGDLAGDTFAFPRPRARETETTPLCPRRGGRDGEALPGCLTLRAFFRFCCAVSRLKQMVWQENKVWEEMQL